MNNIRGIIFDLDGILFDSEYYQWQGWVEPLREYGIELTKEMYFSYAGKSGKQIDQELIKDFNLGIENSTLWNKKKVLIEKWFNEKAMPIMPYAKEAVEYFSSNPNFKIALCSGGDKEEVVTKLEKNDFLKYFPVITAGDDVEKSKPWPDIYLLAVEKLGLDPSQCLAFEDTQYGLQAAKDAGVYCFAIPNEYSLNQDFSRADKVLSSLKEAIDFFKK
ncbi:MAG: HAD family phosphatase [Candidatus Pacebacteria bacterium]|jgi:HAD superfamily hydrolase (TIGR01509 family)|nr:HAD family phosphatase [Candidatus Paceibacterota bacterium]MDD2757086.1 HAD family phosphatase [Candidatus Paceibacterota bacterium]MDD3283706.1 HAD family phosphatase [Candidatus Paceibacterota bacterium]MDD3969819.1 HAD family phosphatase [Candidatus Paceibacterota bacterium]MDD4737769.1 HAD family phosphatase [Candidatus Paceibacterota bacterium]